MVAFTRLDVSRGKETRKKWRARVETGRCGTRALRRVAALYDSAGQRARVGARFLGSRSEAAVPSYAKKNTLRIEHDYKLDSASLDTPSWPTCNGVCVQHCYAPPLA